MQKSNIKAEQDKWVGLMDILKQPYDLKTSIAPKEVEVALWNERISKEMILGLEMALLTLNIQVDQARRTAAGNLSVHVGGMGQQVAGLYLSDEEYAFQVPYLYQPYLTVVPQTLAADFNQSAFASLVKIPESFDYQKVNGLLFKSKDEQEKINWIDQTTELAKKAEIRYSGREAKSYEGQEAVHLKKVFDRFDCLFPAGELESYLQPVLQGRYKVGSDADIRIYVDSDRQVQAVKAEDLALKPVQDSLPLLILNLEWNWEEADNPKLHVHVQADEIHVDIQGRTAFNEKTFTIRDAAVVVQKEEEKIRAVWNYSVKPLAAETILDFERTGSKSLYDLDFMDVLQIMGQITQLNTLAK